MPWCSVLSLVPAQRWPGHRELTHTAAGGSSAKNRRAPPSRPPARCGHHVTGSAAPRGGGAAPSLGGAVPPEIGACGAGLENLHLNEVPGAAEAAGPGPCVEVDSRGRLTVQDRQTRGRPALLWGRDGHVWARTDGRAEGGRKEVGELVLGMLAAASCLFLHRPYKQCPPCTPAFAVNASALLQNPLRSV